VPLEDLLADPVDYVSTLASRPHPKIPLPRDLYADRENSRGVEFANGLASGPLMVAVEKALEKNFVASPLIDGVARPGAMTKVFDPADQRRPVGSVSFATPQDMKLALDVAHKAFPRWSKTPAAVRAKCLEDFADLLEANMPELMALCVREAGKTLPDAVAEVREAVDFCRYYAVEGRKIFSNGQVLQGPTGESNQLFLEGRGVFVCISPWNFPLAIFLGQVSAALMAGNTVIAKPAEQTPLIAMRAIELFLKAGLPKDVLAFVPATGEMTGEHLVPDPRIAGVCFTGSTAVAQTINRALAAKDGPIVPLIAETGGQNAMIVDSSALPEQIVDDVITSAFRSAGQRCSALRVLFLADSIADKVIDMLAGACKELVLGDPLRLSTDVGPVIDQDAYNSLHAHAVRMNRDAKLVAEVQTIPETQHGTFFAPCAFEIRSLSLLTGEVFGPVLHIVRYKPEDIDKVIEQINATGYGLTFGIHSRIDQSIRNACSKVAAGNCYVNRSMIGAVVGVQPFGGQGLSGTGPKAGGPHYLPRFASERTLSINTTASGGNATLVSLAEE
jgi:RHH-type proline utilization regulon transcriptional repressor/proline dehydrogenase/delta 1-pyrroline-5-carboxylate dehydrogenase